MKTLFFAAALSLTFCPTLYAQETDFLTQLVRSSIETDAPTTKTFKTLFENRSELVPITAEFTGTKDGVSLFVSWGLVEGFYIASIPVQGKPITQQGFRHQQHHGTGATVYTGNGPEGEITYEQTVRWDQASRSLTVYEDFSYDVRADSKLNPLSSRQYKKLSSYRLFKIKLSPDLQKIESIHLSYLPVIEARTILKGPKREINYIIMDGKIGEYREVFFDFKEEALKQKAQTLGETVASRVYIPLTSPGAYFACYKESGQWRGPSTKALAGCTDWGSQYSKKLDSSALGEFITQSCAESIDKICRGTLRVQKL